MCACVCLCVIQVLFAWWGAEELGLFGSTHFVLIMDNLNNYACDLNFDMIVSTIVFTIIIHLIYLKNFRVLPIMLE